MSEFSQKYTNRGFQKIEFTDRNSVKCNIQVSSVATEDCVWIGVEDPNPRILFGKAKELGIQTDATEGWIPFPVPDDVSISTRMHINREQAIELIKTLEVFVETGFLFKEDENND